MKIIAIRQDRTGHNIHFISDEYAEYTLSDLIRFVSQVSFENIQILTSKTGKKSLRVKADKIKSNNLENVAITCNDKDYRFFNGRYFYLKTQILRWL